MLFSFVPRPRCPLFVPPGMLALAGLLWLSTATLPRWGAVFYPHCVMQLTLPRLSASDTIWRIPREMRAFLPRSEPELRYSQLPRWRDWDTVEFGYGKVSDSLEAQRMERIVRQVAAEQEWGRCTGLGLRVRFGPYARYASLVRTLDLMNQYNIKKYVLDTHHTPTTFYTLTGGMAPRHRRWQAPPGWPFPAEQSAGITTPASRAPTISWWTRMIRLDNAMRAFPADLTELLTSATWRLPLVLVVAVFAFSIYRLARRQSRLWARMQTSYAAVLAKLETGSL